MINNGRFFNKLVCLLVKRINFDYFFLLRAFSFCFYKKLNVFFVGWFKLYIFGNW